MTRCITFSGSSLTGEEVLAKSGLEYQTVSFGGLSDAVCQIEDEPTTFPPGCWTSTSNFWALFVSRKGGAWAPSSLGVSTQVFRDGDEEGFRFEPQDQPIPPSIHGTCPKVSPAPTPTPAPTARPTPRPTSQPPATPTAPTIPSPSSTIETPGQSLLGQTAQPSGSDEEPPGSPVASIGPSERGSFPGPSAEPSAAISAAGAGTSTTGSGGPGLGLAIAIAAAIGLGGLTIIRRRPAAAGRRQ